MEEHIHDRLKRKYKNIPKWADDFPVDNKNDTGVSRRDFIRYLFLVSAGFFTGTFGLWLRSIFGGREKTGSPVSMKLLEHSDIAIGESYAFRIPESNYPAILVRLGERDYVAYGQKCTHLQSPVLWKKEEHKFLCPCHKGAFSVDTGEVLYGPPERSLPKFKLQIMEDGVYYEGLEAGALI